MICLKTCGEQEVVYECLLASLQGFVLGVLASEGVGETLMEGRGGGVVWKEGAVGRALVGIASGEGAVAGDICRRRGGTLEVILEMLEGVSAVMELVGKFSAVTAVADGAGGMDTCWTNGREEAEVSGEVGGVGVGKREEKGKGEEEGAKAEHAGGGAGGGAGGVAGGSAGSDGGMRIKPSGVEAGDLLDEDMVNQDAAGAVVMWEWREG